VRFHKTFSRQKGGSAPPPVLGGDAVPTTTAPSATADNVMSCKIRDIVGWPVQRIVVGWTTTAGSPVALNGDLYVWEKRLKHWFKVNDTALSIKPNQLAFFDIAALIEPVSNAANVLGNASNPPGAASDSIDVMLVMTDPGAAVAGTYNIGMGPDLTTVGT